MTNTKKKIHQQDCHLNWCHNRTQDHSDFHNCTCHPTPEPSEWERELENLLTKIVRGYLIDDDFESELKQFISTLLAQREKSLIEKIEKMVGNTTALDVDKSFKEVDEKKYLMIGGVHMGLSYVKDNILNSLKGEDS